MADWGIAIGRGFSICVISRAYSFNILYPGIIMVFYLN